MAWLLYLSQSAEATDEGRAFSIIAAHIQRAAIEAPLPLRFPACAQLAHGASPVACGSRRVARVGAAATSNAAAS